MDGRAATITAICIAVVGVVAFVLLDGFAAGAALVVAGMLLVAVGIVGWRERSDIAPGGDGAAIAEMGTEPYLAEAEAAPERRGALEDDAGSRDATSGVPLDDPTRDADDAWPEPVSEDAVGSGEDPVLDTPEDDGYVPEGDYAPAPAPRMRTVGGAASIDHVHDEPLLGHSDLVAHVRDHHHDLPTDGSTIQLRLLHQRAHGAPHEPPVKPTTG